MVIKGIKHLAEISRMTDDTNREERFRYTLQREGSAHVIYWGHEHSETAATQMAEMYLRLLDDCVTELKHNPGSRMQHVQLIASLTPMRAY